MGCVSLNCPARSSSFIDIKITEVVRMKHSKNLTDIELEIGHQKLKETNDYLRQTGPRIIPNIHQSMIIFVCFFSMAIALSVLRAFF